MTTNLQREKCSNCCNGTLKIQGNVTKYYVCGVCGKPCDQANPPTDTTVEKWRLEFVKIRERNYKEKWGDQVALVEEIQFIEKLIALSLQQAKAEAIKEERSRLLNEIGNVASAGNVGEQTKLAFKWLVLELESRWYKKFTLKKEDKL